MSAAIVPPMQEPKAVENADAPLLAIAREVVGETPSADAKVSSDVGKRSADATDTEQVDKDKASMRSALEHRDGVIGLYEALNLPEGGLLGDLLHQSGLPKMSEIPKVYRQRYVDIPAGEPMQEVLARFEDHLPIPIEQYPAIDWKLLFAGDGSTEALAPLTYLERETGAAVLIRTIKRSIANKTSNHMPPSLTAPKDPFARLGGEPMSWMRKDKRMTDNLSNMPFPPTPKADDLAVVKEAKKTAQTPAQQDAPGDKADARAHAVGEANSADKADAPPVFEPGAKEDAPAKAAEPKKAKESSAGKDADEKPPVVDDFGKYERDFFKRLEQEEEERQKRREELMKEIGLHLWICADVESAVVEAKARLQAMIDGAIREYQDREDVAENWTDDEEDADIKPALNPAVEETVEVRL